jgi:hypothetical protein
MDSDLGKLPEASPRLPRREYHSPAFAALVGSIELRLTFETLETPLALNRSVHRLDQASWSLAPEDGVSSAIEIVKQVLDLWAGVQRSVAVVFLVPVAPVQRP